MNAGPIISKLLGTIHTYPHLYFIRKVMAFLHFILNVL